MENVSARLTRSTETGEHSPANRLLQKRYETVSVAFRHTHYTVPLRAYLNHVDTASIRDTMLSITVKSTPDGYDLTALHPIPYARYLCSAAWMFTFATH